MNREWQKEYEFHKPTAAASLPPAMVEETGWDILLALYSGSRPELDLGKLASTISVPPKVLHRWLATMEERNLIVGVRQDFTGELRAVLTQAGRDLLDNYFSAMSGLQSGTDH